MTAAATVETIDQVRQSLAGPRAEGRVIGVVPTMGALHAGHASLIERAREECGFLAVTIYVNPLQFGAGEDLDRYPRSPDDDSEFCASRGVDLIFSPSDAEMYPDEPQTFVQVGAEAQHLCGAHRPGHFRGVATAVLKLFHILEPHRAYFGEKDIQQLAVIRRMVQDWNLGVEIIACPTVRESDGLATSSRNRYLSGAERQSATSLYRALRVMRERIGDGTRDAAVSREAGRAVLELEPSVRVEYLEVVDATSMQPVSEITGPVRAAGAVWIGKTRLIDNVLCEPGKKKRRARSGTGS